MSMGGGGSSKVKQTTKVEAEPWSELPDLKRFWDEFVSVFWGEPSPSTPSTGGGTKTTVSSQDISKYLPEDKRVRYERLKKSIELAEHPTVDYEPDPEVVKQWKRELESLESEALSKMSSETSEDKEQPMSFRRMLEEDNEYLKQKYDEYNSQLTNLENQMMQNVVGAYGRRLANQPQPTSIGLSLYGKPAGSLVPGYEQRRVSLLTNLLNDKLSKELEMFKVPYQTKAQQIERNLNIAKEFTPHKTDIQYLAKLEDLARYGQSLRHGLQSQTQTAYSSGGGSPIKMLGDLLSTGTALYGLANAAGLLGSGIGNTGALWLGDTVINAPAGAATATGLSALASNPATWAIGLPLLGLGLADIFG